MTQMTGKIFDIQRFSLHDGPGIRTTVFLKGCSLRCLWCHNPESQKKENELAFYKHKCVSCGKCAQICQKAFTADCTACGKCAEVCGNGAREIIGKDITAKEVFDVVVRDKAFYETSGGGVTLSGGEPLLQADFAAEILKLSKEAGIETAIETAGNTPWESFEKVLPYCDLFLYDIKAIDEEKHRELTGASNRLILENAEKIRRSDKKTLFRMPVVPGYNDDELGKACSFSEKNLEILAYHDIGRGKYESLMRPYLIDAKPQTTEQMKALAQKYGVTYRPTGV